MTAPVLSAEVLLSRRYLLTGGFALAALPIAADDLIRTDDAGLRTGEVRIPAPDRELRAWRALPSAPGPHPTVLVVQEIFGVHEHIRDVCRRLAHQGYQAIAPDLYARYGDPTTYTDVKTLIADLVTKVPDAEVMADLDATARWAGINGGDPDRLAVTGFCWGGRIVWLYAAHNPRLKAAVAWYGGLARPATERTPRQPVDLVDALHAPVLGLYGGADSGIPNDHVERMQALLSASAAPNARASEIVLYPDTPHGFHADYRPSYRHQQARDGWARLLDWFVRHGMR